MVTIPHQTRSCSNKCQLDAKPLVNLAPKLKIDNNRIILRQVCVQGQYSTSFKLIELAICQPSDHLLLRKFIIINFTIFITIFIRFIIIIILSISFPLEIKSNILRILYLSVNSNNILKGCILLQYHKFEDKLEKKGIRCMYGKI